MEHTEDVGKKTDAAGQLSGLKGFFKKHGSNISLAVLIGYIILLAIGVTAEVFRIQWILDWWIWSPPGKFK